MAQDFYHTLGIAKTASKDDIKKAFHKLAHKYHPDKKDGNEAKFKEVNEAYQTLSDDSKRSQYDQYGSAGPNMGGGFGGGQGGGFGGFDFSGFSQGGSGQGFEFDMGDIFGDMFGGGSRRNQVHRGNDLQTTINLTFKESVFGTEKEISMTKPFACATCKGDGAKPGTGFDSCKNCDGKGSIRHVQRTILGNIATNSTCDVCMGKGKIPKEKCSTCKGAGVVRDTRTVKVQIPAGIQNGETLRVQGMGDAIQGGESGDLYIRISVAMHKNIARQGSDLYAKFDVSLTDAILGDTFEIETLDGSQKFEVPPGSQLGDSVVLKHLGVANQSGKRGNFIIQLHIKLPTKLSKQAKNLIEELKKEGI
jgi:molecular chaperone DnaJ